MKFTKLSAAGATIALAASAVFGASLAANAIEVDVPVDEIGVETNPYTEGEWFLGNPVGDAPTQDETGLTIPGQNQLLYGWSDEPISGDDFTDFVQNTSFVGTDDTLTFQVPVFFNGTDNTDFTTLRPAVPGSPSIDTPWVVSRTAGGLTVGTQYTFLQIAAAFDTAQDAEILAFGVFVNPGTSAVLESFTVFEDTWNFATPTAVVPPVVPPAVVPTPIQKPVTFTG